MQDDLLQITVFYAADVPAGSLADKKKFLTGEFNKISGLMAKLGIIDIGEVSAPGQILPARIPESKFAAADRELAKKKFRLIPDQDRPVGL